MPQEWTQQREVEREVVSITLVHNFHTQTSAVENVCPGVEHTTLTIDDGLVEVETVQVECHRGNTKCGEPDANNRPSSKEEVQRTGVVKGSVLEDQATEVTVSGNDVVGLFFLTELVTIVLGLSFRGFTNQRRSNETSMHSREQSTEYPSNTEHVERMHKDIVFCLEYKHIVKSTRDTKRHSIGERSLTERIDEEYSRSSSDRCAVGNADPRTHTQTIGKFPLTTHVGIDADQEVEDYELERTTVIQLHRRAMRSQMG